LGGCCEDDELVCVKWQMVGAHHMAVVGVADAITFSVTTTIIIT
jgi:hypothetical protein